MSVEYGRMIAEELHNQLEHLSEGWEAPNVLGRKKDEVAWQKLWQLDVKLAEEMSARIELDKKLAGGIWAFIKSHRKKPLSVRIHDWASNHISVWTNLFRLESELWYWTIARVFEDWERYVIARCIEEQLDINARSDPRHLRTVRRKLY